MDYADIAFCLTIIAIISIIIIYYNFFHSIIEEYLTREQANKNIQKIKQNMKTLDQAQDLVKIKSFQYVYET